MEKPSPTDDAPRSDEQQEHERDAEPSMLQQEAEHLAHAKYRADSEADVLCQPPSAVADAGLPSSASRSALRAASSVTAAPAIRSVAARSGRGPDGVGMVTAMCGSSSLRVGSVRSG